jgi:hypothetical protein
MTTRDDKRQNISLIIGLSIPVAMILFIAIAINGPRWLSNVEPANVNFLYATGQQDPDVVYSVKDGRLAVTDNTPEHETGQAEYPTHFFIHDVTTNTSREIQFDEAKRLLLDGAVRSPDGFTISDGRRRGWFIFGYGRYDGHRYLVKESYSQKLDLETDSGTNHYYWNYRFIGWVTGNE